MSAACCVPQSLIDAFLALWQARPSARRARQRCMTRHSWRWSPSRQRSGFRSSPTASIRRLNWQVELLHRSRAGTSGTARGKGFSPIRRNMYAGEQPNDARARRGRDLQGAGPAGGAVLRRISRCREFTVPRRPSAKAPAKGHADGSRPGRADVRHRRLGAALRGARDAFLADVVAIQRQHGGRAVEPAAPTCSSTSRATPAMSTRHARAHEGARRGSDGQPFARGPTLPTR